MTGTRPAAIVFDATGTLIEPRESVGEVYHRIALEHGVDLPAWRLDDAFRRVLRHAPVRGLEGADVAARRAGEVDWWSERIRQTFQATDSTARFDDFPRFASALFSFYATGAAWQVRPGMPALLEDLSSRGHPMAIVSNFDHRLPDLLEALEIKHYFRAIVLPFELVAAKPDRAVFAAAAAVLECPVDELVYVGDDPPEQMNSIAKLGIRTLDVNQVHSPTELADQLSSVT